MSRPTAAPLNTPGVEKNDDVQTGIQVPQLENDHVVGNGTKAAGLAIIEQDKVIPRTGERKVTTQWEYWTYTLFCMYHAPRYKGLCLPA
jgi:hypothetical protein